MWRKEEFYIFWSNKQENGIYSAAFSVNVQKLESSLKGFINESRTPLVSIY